MLLQKMKNGHENSPVLYWTRRYLATLVVALACLSVFHAPISYELAAVAAAATLDTFALPGAFDLALYAKTRVELDGSARGTASSLDDRGTATLGLAAATVASSAFPFLAMSLGGGSSLVDDAGLVSLVIAAFAGSRLGVRAATSTRGGLPEMLTRLELMVDVLVLLEAAQGRTRAYLTALARLLLGLVLLSPFPFVLSRLNSSPPIGDALLMVPALAALFQLGLVLMAQGLLALRWAAHRPGIPAAVD